MTSMTLPPIRLALLAALLSLPAAHAAAFDCKAAATPTERAICADPALRDLDAELGSAYAQALHATADGSAALRQQQRDWLRTRDACGADAGCLATQYRQRLARFARPDAGDLAALEALRVAVEAARRGDPEFPFEKAIKPLTVTTGATAFANTEHGADDGADDQDGTAHFPRVKPDGVTDAEWHALQASHIEGGGENGRSDYMLVDLDGDGLRDLVIDTYIGGTGLFSETRVLRQEAGKFVVPGIGVVNVNATDGDAPGAAYLYAHGERGANVQTAWVRLHGRVYALYREATYGADNVLLLRPWAGAGQVPRLTIRYRYKLSVPAMQPAPGSDAASDKRPQVRLDPLLHRALNAALARVNPSAIDARTDTAPLCPVPADASEEARADSAAYGPVHYTIEAVADFAVHVGQQCYIAQLRDWFGSYAPQTGLAADLCLRKPQETPEPDAEQCYAVEGKRSVVAVTADVGPFGH